MTRESSSPNWNSGEDPKYYREDLYPKEVGGCLESHACCQVWESVAMVVTCGALGLSLLGTQGRCEIGGLKWVEEGVPARVDITGLPKYRPC